MTDVEKGEEKFNCMICLDNKDIKRKIYCLNHYDKVQKINCQCNTYCHKKCIKENIFKHNNGSQICFVCKKEYSPKYINRIDVNKYQFFLHKLCLIMKINYFIFVYFLFYFLFFIVSSYLFQFLSYIFTNNINLYPFSLIFFLEGIVSMTIIYLILTRCNPQNENNMYVKIITKFTKIFNINY